MAGHEPGALALAALNTHASLLNLLINKGVITQAEAVKTLHDAVAGMSANPQLSEIKAAMRQFWPAAGL